MWDDENKNFIKRKCKSEEINEKNEFQSYLDNLDNLTELKNNLNEENKYLVKFNNALENNELVNVNNNIKSCYEKKLLEKNDTFKLDKELFEFRAKKIFSEVYELKEKILYPYFIIEYSKNKKANIIKIYYYQIEIKNENNNPICFSFPEAINTFLIKYEKKPIIIKKKADDDFVMSVISKDFNHSIDFHFIKKKDCFMTSLIHAEISDELFQGEINVKETKNKIDSLNGKQINNMINNHIVNINNKEENELKIQKQKSKDNNREDNIGKEILNNNKSKDNIDNNNNNSIQKSSELETLKKKLKLYETKLKLIKEKYSKENIIKELTKKNKELKILNLEIELDGNKEDSEAKKNALKKEIEEYEKLLKPITLTIRKLYQEFDGLYINKKEFALKNNLGFEITIPPNSFVIVEIKNNNNYCELYMNLNRKAKIFNSIGFPLNKFFFVGILRSLDEERITKGQLRKLKSKNIIIIYPNETTFLGVSLFDEKIKNKVKEEKKEKVYSSEDKRNKIFEDKVIKMLGDLLNEVKEIKIKMSNMDNKIGTMSKDINYLKNKINKEEN